MLRDPAVRDVLGTGHLGQLTRYTLPVSGDVRVEVLDVVDAEGRRSYAELPCFNEAVAGRPYQYAYLWAPQAWGTPSWASLALLKKDVQEREESIADKERRLSELKAKNKELEKFKVPLDPDVVRKKLRKLQQAINDAEKHGVDTQRASVKVTQAIKALTITVYDPAGGE